MFLNFFISDIGNKELLNCCPERLCYISMNELLSSHACEYFKSLLKCYLVLNCELLYEHFKNCDIGTGQVA